MTIQSCTLNSRLCLKKWRDAALKDQLLLSLFSWACVWGISRKLLIFVTTSQIFHVSVLWRYQSMSVHFNCWKLISMYLNFLSLYYVTLQTRAIDCFLPPLIFNLLTTLHHDHCPQSLAGDVSKTTTLASASLVSVFSFHNLFPKQNYIRKLFNSKTEAIHFNCRGVSYHTSILVF